MSSNNRLVLHSFQVECVKSTDKTLLKKINRWCEEAGGNITINAIEHQEKEKVTRVDESNPFWVAFENGATEA